MPQIHPTYELFSKQTSCVYYCNLLTFCTLNAMAAGTLKIREELSLLLFLNCKNTKLLTRESMAFFIRKWINVSSLKSIYSCLSYSRVRSQATRQSHALEFTEVTYSSPLTLPCLAFPMEKTAEIVPHIFFLCLLIEPGRFPLWLLCPETSEINLSPNYYHFIYMH